MIFPPQIWSWLCVYSWTAVRLLWSGGKPLFFFPPHSFSQSYFLIFLHSLFLHTLILHSYIHLCFKHSSRSKTRRCCTRPTWTSGAATWRNAYRSTRGTWSSASRWQGVRRRPAASAWRLSLTSPRGRQGTSERFACPYPTWIILCPGLESFPTAPTASACPASASGGRPSSSSTRSFAPARSAGRPQTTSAPADFGWRLLRRREDC